MGWLRRAKKIRVHPSYKLGCIQEIKKWLRLCSLCCALSLSAGRLKSLPTPSNRSNNVQIHAHLVCDNYHNRPAVCLLSRCRRISHHRRSLPGSRLSRHGRGLHARWRDRINLYIHLFWDTRDSDNWQIAHATINPPCQRVNFLP